MKTLCRIVIGLAIVTLVPEVGTAQKVTSDYKITQDFTLLRTFALKDGGQAENSEEATLYDSPFIRQRTNAAIAAELERRGLRRDDAQPDIYASAKRTFRTEQVIYPAYGWGWSYPYGWGWGYPYGWGWAHYGGGPSYVEEEVIGTLTVDLEDAASGELLWRGSAVKRVHRTSSMESRSRRIVREVSKVFDDFPPGADDDD
jgi:hypothetical protein